MAIVGTSRNVVLSERSVEHPLCFFLLFIFFLLNHAFTRSFCLACEGCPEETILWGQVSCKGSWALRSQSLMLHSSSLRHCDYEKISPNYGSGKPLVWREIYFWACILAQRLAERGTILVFGLSALTRPGLDLGLSRTVYIHSFIFEPSGNQHKVINVGTNLIQSDHRYYTLVSFDLLGTICTQDVSEGKRSSKLKNSLY